MTEDVQDHSNSESLSQRGTVQQQPYCRLPTMVSNGRTLLLCSSPCWVPPAARPQLISIHLTLSSMVQGAVVLLTQMNIASVGRQVPPSPLPGCAQKRLHIAKAFQPVSQGPTSLPPVISQSHTGEIWLAGKVYLLDTKDTVIRRAEWPFCSQHKGVTGCGVSSVTEQVGESESTHSSVWFCDHSDANGRGRRQELSRNRCTAGD